MAYGTLYAKETLKITGDQLSLLFVGYNIIILTMRFILGRNIHRMNKKRVLEFALLNNICMMIIISLGNSIIFSVAFLLSGCSMGIIYPIGAMWVVEVIIPTNLVLANAFYSTMWDVGSFLGPFSSSFIVDALQIPVTIVASTIPPAVALILVFTLWKEKPLSKEANNLLAEKEKPQD